MKKHIRIIISILLIIGLLAGGSFSALADPVTSPDGHMTINKTATAVQDLPRTYEVQLSINGTLPQPKPLDVILVIDSSNSMKDVVGGKTLFTYAKEAAKSLTQKLLPTGNNTNRVAIVTFGYTNYGYNYGPGTLDTDSWLDKNFTYNQGQVISTINNLGYAGGTNTQAGFRRAKNTMVANARAGADKIIVFLSDGVPSVSIGNAYGPNEPTEHNIHTTAAYQEAQSMFPSGYKIFTVGLFGGITDNDVKRIAQETMQWSQNAGYKECQAAADLTDIYNQIYEQMNYYAANTLITDQIEDEFELVENSIVTRINGQVVTSPSVNYNPSTRTITWEPGNLDSPVTLTYRIKALDSFGGGENIPTNVQATINYTNVTGTPNQTLTFPVPTVNVPGLVNVQAEDKTIVIGDEVNLRTCLTSVSGGTTPYSYSWTWDGGSSTTENTVVSPTKDTQYTITVTDKNAYSASASFWVRVKKGTIVVHKQVTNGGSGSKIFSIHMAGGPLNQHWNVLAQNGGSYTITNLKPGTYSISETVPMDYRLVRISNNTVTFTRDDILSTEAARHTRHVTVTNQKINVPWFWDTTSVSNIFQARANF